MIPRPPPIILFTACFGAGLVAGLVGFSDILQASALFVLGLVLRRRTLSLLVIAVALGVIHGSLARRFDATRCSGLLRPGPVSFDVQLQDPGRDGMVTAIPVGDEVNCSGVVSVRWTGQTDWDAGQRLHVRGRWVVRRGRGGRPDGVLVAQSIAPSADGVGRSVRQLRGSIVSVAERLYGARAAMVEALVLGRRHQLDPGLRDAFARSGLVHLLAISGFHVGLLAGWVFVLGRLLRLRGHAARGVSLTVAGLYVNFLGWPPPATRAVVLMGVVALATLRQRRVQPTPLLAACCLVVMLIDPWAVRDVGAWLSVVTIWGVTRFTRWSDVAIGRYPPIRMTFASLGATLAAAPLTAAVFGTVAVVGIGLNLVAIPLAGLTVPAVFLSLGLDPIMPELSRSFAAAGGLGLAALEALARVGAAIPRGAILVEPSMSSAIPWILVLVGVSWVLSRRSRGREARRRVVLMGSLSLWAGLLVGLGSDLGPSRPGLTLYHLDVGQGDAAVIRTPRGRWLMIDAGAAGRGGDAGRRIVAPFLQRRRASKVAVLVVSHAHADHIGGAAGVFDRLGIETVLDPAVPVDDSLYLAFLDRVGAEGAQWHAGRRGDRWSIDGMTVAVLHPDTLWAAWRENLNEDSLVLLVEYGRFRAVFAGDAGHPVEASLRGQVGPVSMLKVGHHGSRLATGREWAGELSPAVAIVSVGRNSYGHPSTEALRNLETVGASVWRTDQDGTVTLWTDGRMMEVEGRSRREVFELGEGGTSITQEVR